MSNAGTSWVPLWRRWNHQRFSAAKGLDRTCQPYTSPLLLTLMPVKILSTRTSCLLWPQFLLWQKKHRTPSFIFTVLFHCSKRWVCLMVRCILWSKKYGAQWVFNPIVCVSIPLCVFIFRILKKSLKTILRHNGQFPYHTELTILRTLFSWGTELMGQFLFPYFAVWCEDSQTPMYSPGLRPSVSMKFCIFLLLLWWYQPLIFSRYSGWFWLPTPSPFCLCICYCCCHVSKSGRTVLSPCGSWGARVSG